MKIPNTMMLANAGSGKTYALTTRFVTLLANGVNPEKIAALTFTRKAAGEFLDAVFHRIAEAAIDPGKLITLRKDTGCTDLDEGKCVEMLEKLSLKAGMLRMGTIDSLFARIAKAFPLESGLPGEFQMIGDSELKHAREEALAAVFREQTDGEGLEGFVDLVRRASRRGGEVDVFTTLYKILVSRHEAYLQTPPQAGWGNPKTIWPDGNTMLGGGDPRGAAEDLRSAIKAAHPDLTDAVSELWDSWLDSAASFSAGKPCTEVLEGFIEKLLAPSADKSTGESYIPVGKGNNTRVYLLGNVAGARLRLLHVLLKPAFEKLLGRSAGQYDFMERYEQVYDVRTRSSGLLTFQDVTDLLAAQAGDQRWMGSVGYRLDGIIQHYLLDEFQDTSRQQWKVLSPFVGEVLQDTEGDRSLFYVGDTKQAIYSWRGGDPELFFEIRDHYNGESECIIEKPLSVSQRSAREIIQMVNAVFGDIDSVSGPLGYPGATVSNWKRAFTKHLVATRNEGLEGYVRWVQAEDNGQADEEEGIHIQDLETLAILREVKPWKHGKSCAVLVRTNKQLEAISTLLQSDQEQIPVSVEGKSNPCTDNTLGASILAAFRLVASPGDKLSSTLLNSCEFGKKLLEDGEAEFREEALASISDTGYEKTIRKWLKGLKLPPFLASRSIDFLAAASDYDASARGAIADFISFIESRKVEEPESSGVVRLMTLHQSKGLTFDMTVVSGLDRSDGNHDEKIYLRRDDSPERTPQWGCLMPRRDLALIEPNLNAALEETQARAAYEKLCMAYVAMTRSRNALYVVTNRIGAKSTARNFGRLLSLTLNPGSPVYEVGNEKWYEVKEGAKEEGEGVDEEVKKARLSPCSACTPHALSPSSLSLKVKQAREFAVKSSFSSDAAELGTEIHEVLSRIGWDPGAADLGSCSAEARRLLGIFLKTPEAESLFARPGEDWQFWNEKPFDLMIDGQWISGIFDRVHIRKESDKAAEARIYDYKTNRATPEDIAGEYEGQMEQYRQAAAKLLGIGNEKVTARTVPIRQVTCAQGTADEIR